MNLLGSTLLPGRLWRKVKVGPKLRELGPCWLWTGYTFEGYGRWGVFGKVVPVHVSVYEALVGPVPEGYELDHLCRVRNCCNPSHLEPVSHQVNIARGNSNYLKNRTHCPKGHPYDASNTRYHKNGKYTKRLCRICKKKGDA